VGNIHKEWDMVSDYGRIIGDAKNLSMVHGKSLPPAKFSIIVEHVWLLDKAKANIKFLEFWNQIEGPMLLLGKYGNLVSNVQFYIMDDEENVEQLK
jgi:hypothetical protein